MSKFYEFQLAKLDGTLLDSAELRGKVVLIVNVASQCGFTKQYGGLETLSRRYADQLLILGFPCNQFGNQEPGSAEEISAFCTLNYDVTFPIMAKCDVNGEHAHPFYQWLKKQKPGFLGLENVKWNFTKFLIDQEGNVVDRFAPQAKPENLAEQIREML